MDQSFDSKGEDPNKVSKAQIMETHLCGHERGDTVVEWLHVLWLDTSEVVFVRKHIDDPWVPTGQQTQHAL